jgi:hypothetical protein
VTATRAGGASPMPGASGHRHHRLRRHRQRRPPARLQAAGLRRRGCLRHRRGAHARPGSSRQMPGPPRIGGGGCGHRRHRRAALGAAGDRAVVRPPAACCARSPGDGLRHRRDRVETAGRAGCWPSTTRCAGTPHRRLARLVARALGRVTGEVSLVSAPPQAWMRGSPHLDIGITAPITSTRCAPSGCPVGHQRPRRYPGRRRSSRDKSPNGPRVRRRVGVVATTLQPARAAYASSASSGPKACSRAPSA